MSAAMISTTNAGIWSISSLRGSDAPVIEARIFCPQHSSRAARLSLSRVKSVGGGPLSITVARVRCKRRNVDRKSLA